MLYDDVKKNCIFLLAHDLLLNIEAVKFIYSFWMITEQKTQTDIARCTCICCFYFYKLEEEGN